ncbi:MAG: apolipoprotein N-acyltransferase [Planctomycetota bacterium]
MKASRTRDILLVCLPFLASGVLLTVIQPPISWSLLALVALVPFVLVCSPAAKVKRLALAAYLVSLVYWLGNLYWVFPITIVGWGAYCLYQSLHWPILALCLRYCRMKKVPLVLAVPVLFVGAERLQGLFLGGFFWRFLAHSQFENIRIIQIADIFGAGGVSFLLAMINGYLAESIIAWRRGRLLRIRTFVEFAVVCCALAGAIVYGRWRIDQSERFVEAGPRVAALQSNVPQSVKRTFQAGEELFADLMADSIAAAGAGAELIVWPETMVQAILSKQVWPFLVSSESNSAFDLALCEHAKDTAHVLVGAYGADVRQAGGRTYMARFNSAFLYTPQGQQAAEQYDKIHLVPFGEVVPFRRRLPRLYDFLMKFTPYNYDYSLDYGSDYTIFRMTGAQSLPGGYRFGVMICYEDTIPGIAREFALDRGGRKRVDWLVNISNDGWFVRFKGEKVLPSTELPQHVAVCVFRSVENRLAVVRSVNTGISCVIDTLGRVKNGVGSGTLPANAMDRKGMAGWLVDNLPIDRRLTLFSKYGQWLDMICASILVVMVIFVPLARLFKAKEDVGHNGKR